MSDHSKPMTITVSYEREQNGIEQQATCKIHMPGDNTAEVSWEFMPDLSDDTDDPMGLMIAVFTAVNETISGSKSPTE